MITLFHGDNFIASRQALNQLIAQAKLRNKEVVRLDGQRLKDTDLIQSLESDSLFHSNRIFVIYRLRPELEKILQRNQEKEVYLWETKKKTVPANFRSQEFRLTKTVFRFLDTFNLSLLQQTLASEPIELVFYLTHRRVARLIQFGSKKYSLAQLIRLHQQLLEIDFQLKSGLNPLPLAWLLELALISL